jgi:hypothetical protein
MTAGKITHQNFLMRRRFLVFLTRVLAPAPTPKAATQKLKNTKINQPNVIQQENQEKVE